MPHAQVFISHSVTRSPRAEAYLSALTKALKKQPRVKAYWLDRKDLKPGDAWRAKIFRALRESHGAILLLSKEGVEESEFVQIEASYLCIQETRPVVPILIDVDEKRLDQGVWGRLRINDLQAIRNCAPDEAANQAIAALTRRINLDNVTPDPWEQLRGLIAQDFADAGVEFYHVERLRGQFKGLSAEQKMSFPRERETSAACAWLADTLMRSSSLCVEKALTGLRRMRLQHGPTLSGVLDRLAPYWVDERTADAIGHLATGAPAKRQFGIGISDEWTLEAYACRARDCVFGERPQPISYPAITRERQAASIAAEADSIVKFIVEQLPLATRTDATIREYIRQQELAGWPILVSFASDWWPPNVALVAAIRERLKHVMLCFRTGDGNRDDADTDISWLSAAIEPSELEISVRYQRVKCALG